MWNRSRPPSSRATGAAISSHESSPTSTRCRTSTSEGSVRRWSRSSPAPSSVAVTAAFLPAAAIVLAAGLLVAGVAVPAVAAAIGRRSGRLEAAARGELTAELVDTIGGAPELAVYGLEDESLDRLRRADHSLVRLARRAALAEGAGDGLRLLVTGATVAGVLAVAVSAHAAGDLDRVLIAMLALLAFASFEAVQPLSQAARELAATLAAGQRLLELTDRAPAIVDPPRPSTTSGAAVRRRARERARAVHAPRRRPSSTVSTSGSSPAAASHSSARAAPARPPSSTCSCASSTPRRDA